MASKQSRSHTEIASRKQQINSTEQSDSSLSQSSSDQDDDGRFSVAEEVNLDQQSDQARHVGQSQMSLDWGEVEGDQTSSADTELKPKQKNTRKEKLKQSLNRAIPHSQ